MSPVRLLFLGAAVLAVVGAVFGSAWAAGAGAVTVLVLLAVHPTVLDAAVPRSTRLLLQGGLLLLAVAVIVDLWGWTAPTPGDSPPSANELSAPMFLRQSAVAGFWSWPVSASPSLSDGCPGSGCAGSAGLRRS